MGSKGSKHICYFILEQTEKGYFTGYLICSQCEVKIPQSQWLENIDPARADFSSYTASSQSSSPEHVDRKAK